MVQLISRHGSNSKRVLDTHGESSSGPVALVQHQTRKVGFLMRSDEQGMSNVSVISLRRPKRTIVSYSHC